MTTNAIKTRPNRHASYQCFTYFYGILSAARNIVLLLCAFGLPLSVNAQTEFDIESSGADMQGQFKKELDHWMLAAYEGDRDAQFKVGVLFTNNQFSEPDFEQAVYWYKQAARQGHVLAQYNLGHQYLIGQGVEENQAEAINWWLKAANSGHPLAQFNIGRASYLGIGLKKDEKEARRWFEKATANGEPKSAAILVELGWDENLDTLLTQAREKAAKEAEQQALADAGTINKPDAADRSKDFVSRVTPTEIIQPTTAEPTRKSLVLDEPLANREPSANQEPSAYKEPSADREPSAGKEPSTEKATSANQNTTLASVPSPKPLDSSSALSHQSNTGKATPRVSSGLSSDNTRFSKLASATTQTATTKTPAPSSVATSPKPTAKQPTAKPASSNIGEAFSAPQKTRSNQNAPSSIALYSNPGLRSVLISLTNDLQSLKVVKREDVWTVVTQTDGFPVWVHQDYIKVAAGVGTIKGRNVGARSVPIVAKETLIGRFKNKEMVAILGQRNEWYRVSSPSRFKAWVKSAELLAFENRANATSDSAPKETAKPIDQPRTSSPAPSPAKQAKTLNASSTTPAIVSATTSTAPNNPFSESGQRDAHEHHEWLFSQAPGHFTIQLASFYEPERVAAFLAKIKFADDPQLHQLEAITRDRYWTYFVYGSFADKGRAEATKQQLKQSRGLVRIFGKLQVNRCLSWYLTDPQDQNLQRYCANIDYQ